MELTVFSFSSHLLMLCVCSLALAMPMHGLIEGPLSCLTDGKPQDAPMPRAAAAA